MMSTVARHRILLAATMYPLIGVIPVVISLFSADGGPSNGEPSNPSPIGIFIALSLFALMPICGLYAFIGARRELKNMKGSSSTPDVSWKMRFIAMASASGTIIWLPIAAMTILTLIPHGDIQLPRDSIINDMNNIAAEAYSFRLRPNSMGGGEGSYLGYQIPLKMRTNENGSYRIVFLYPDSIFIEGQSEREVKGAVRVKIDSQGRLSNWRYFGDMDY
jgi:hypothetical protein